MSFLLSALTVVLASTPSLAALTSPLGPVVDLGYAAYAGNASLPGSVFFGGIPYIKAPIGDLRFRAPQKLDEYKRQLSNNDVIDSRYWGPLCIQQPAVSGIGAEDCVHATIWTPPGVVNTNAKLPVYVYIHGGGYYYNSAQGFPGNQMVANSNGGLIVVNLQYRMGLLGFLAGKKVTQYNDGSVNNGLLDQREGLEWIQRNIAAFGGDPAKVTIGGESAGAGAVVLHMTAYGGETNPPFRAAVIQSAGNDPFYTDEQTETCFNYVAEHTGCASAQSVIACLRKVPIPSIVSAVNNKPSSCKFLPVVDGNYVPDITSKMLYDGKFSKVPVLGGWMGQDASIFIGRPETLITDADVAATITKRYSRLSSATAAELIKVYGPANATTPWKNQWERALYAYQDSEFTCWPYIIGKNSGKATYNYRFDATDPNLIAARGPHVQAAHTADLFYLYMGTNSGPSSSVAQPVFSRFSTAEAAVASQAVSWWGSFARTLDPNTHAVSGSPEWKTQASGHLVIGKTAAESQMTTFDVNQQIRCDWWRSIADELRL